MVQQHFPAHHGDIARGGKVACLIQPAGVAESGALHTQLFGAGVHRSTNSGFAAADKFGHGHCGIIGAGNADGFQHVVKRHLLAGLQPDLAAAHVIGVLTDGDNIVR